MSGAIGAFSIGVSPIGGVAPLAQCTPLEIIRMAAMDAGILGDGQELTGLQYSDAFRRLNWIIAQWNQRRFLVYRLAETVCVSTGAQEYTVGPTGNFNIDITPRRIDAAFVRQLQSPANNQVDYPLKIIWAKEDYILIASKSIGNFPQCCFYDSNWPIASVKFWPVPQASIYEMHILTKQLLQSFSSQTQIIAMPDEYQVALQTELACRLGTAYKIPPSPDLVAQAKNALNVLRLANNQVPRALMPVGVRYRPTYNIFTDQWS